MKKLLKKHLKKIMSINNLKNTAFKILKADDRIWNKELKAVGQKIYDRAKKIGLNITDTELLSAMDLWNQSQEAVFSEFGFLEILKNLKDNFDSSKTPANIIQAARHLAFVNPEKNKIDAWVPLPDLIVDQDRRQGEVYNSMAVFKGLSRSPYDVPNNVKLSLGEGVQIDTHYMPTVVANTNSNLAGGGGHNDHATLTTQFLPSINRELGNQFQAFLPLPGKLVEIYTPLKNHEILP
jgi:hypothetical protein